MLRLARWGTGMSSTSRSEPTLNGPSLSTEQQLAIAVEALSDHVLLLDAQDRIVLANKAWRELNLEVEEFTRPGTLFEDHLRALLRLGLVPKASGREDEWLRERMERHRNPSGPFELARQDGRWFRAHEQRLPNGGTMLILRDITAAKRAEQALRESEARFRAVVDNSPAKIHIKDAQGRYVLINPVAASLFGVSEDEARGKTTHEVFPKDLADAFTVHDRTVLESGKAVEQDETWRHPDGLHTYLTVKFPILDSAGVVTGIGAIGTDITEHKRVEDRLRSSEKDLQLRVAELEVAQRKLEAQEANLTSLAKDLKMARDKEITANRAKSEFLAAMSHELRTPLNAIIGFSEVLMTEAFGPIGSSKYRDYADDIHESGLHLLDLINDVLDLSKVEAGQEELHEEIIEIQDLTDSVWRLIQQRAGHRGVALTLKLPEAPSLLRADVRKMKQVLVNLLSNAIKFTDPGGTVSLEVHCGADAGYVFQVTDTGIGMAPEDIPKALSQFGQIDSTFTRQNEGTGLGLPLAKSLVELHGGSLDLESTAGVGTTVTVRLPAERITDKGVGTQAWA